MHERAAISDPEGEYKEVTGLTSAKLHNLKGPSSGRHQDVVASVASVTPLFRRAMSKWRIRNKALTQPRYRCR